MSQMLHLLLLILTPNTELLTPNSGYAYVIENQNPISQNRVAPQSAGGRKPQCPYRRMENVSSLPTINYQL